MFSSASRPAAAIPSQPAAISSTDAVIPDPRAPTIATRPGSRGISGVAARSALPVSAWNVTCDGMAARQRLACKRGARQVALDPRVAVVGRPAECRSGASIPRVPGTLAEAIHTDCPAREAHSSSRQKLPNCRLE